MIISELTAHLESLIHQGGPGPDEYAALDGRVDEARAAVCAGAVGEHELSGLRRLFDEEFRRETVHGHGLSKPFGYAGDFLMIDKIYLRHRTPLEPLAAWDDYFHAHAAPEAVRNRKTFFGVLLSELQGTPATVLDIGSGPGRDVKEALEAARGIRPTFTLVDMDPRATRYASRLLRAWQHEVRFECTNAFRFRTSSAFDLVWSAGLFDYLDDRRAVVLLRRMWKWTKPGGEVVVGNFSLENPSRAYMELLGEWHLIHRSPEDLLRLGAEAGLPAEMATVEQEELGVNLFLRVKKPT